MERSKIAAASDGATALHFGVSERVPFRVFTLAAPARLVIDFKGLVDDTALSEDVLQGNGAIRAVRFGQFRPGWARLVADLNLPVVPQDISFSTSDTSAGATLRMRLVPVSAETFIARSGAPDAALWTEVVPRPRAGAGRDDTFVVAIDPGHGGIDPGAERDGVTEKALMLGYALALRARLEQAEDVEVVLTRTEDTFVALERRVAIAHQVQADLFLSLHADALSQGGAQGATIYTLSDEASDKASAYLAARHNRADVLAGVDLTGSDDEVTRLLLDIARRETEPRTEALAQALVQSIGASDAPLNNRPIRRAGFSVLKSADIPSVLLEIGFLSSQRDLDNIRQPEWQVMMVEAIARGVLSWRGTDAASRKLVRR
ncbi:MAG: N-acetylmuramoyl-L-alanine amidase [Pseudomonadota bacterium]